MSPCGNLLNEGLSEFVQQNSQCLNRGVTSIVSPRWKEDNRELAEGCMSIGTLLGLASMENVVLVRCLMLKLLE